MPNKLKCKQCNFEWTPRIQNPRACPKCKRYDWNTSNYPRKENKQKVK